MKQQIRKPENWQDFEELCKLLWGEMWDCPEIKKNGRSGQTQHGVDIYGIPKGEKKYNGIQCKGKDEYSNAILTEDEIIAEIEKAKKFKPTLAKLYFTTTANKDVKIEEFVRLRNVEHLEKEMFEIHLFSWEDIVYLIDQNKRTHDWYVRKINFASRFKVEVLFENDSFIREYDPPLVKHVINYIRKNTIPSSALSILHHKSEHETRNERVKIDTEPQPARHFITSTVKNKSSCVFGVKIKNIGNEQLENIKLYLKLNDEGYTSERVFKQRYFLDKTEYVYNIHWTKPNNDLEFRPIDTLVQNDEIVSDFICLRPNIEYPFCITIPWKLVAKDFSEEGRLIIILNTKIKEKLSQKISSEHRDDDVILENSTD